MTPFPIGVRVDLKSCPGFPGTVVGFTRGKIQVIFDDCGDEATRSFRPESLQLAEKQVPGA